MQELRLVSERDTERLAQALAALVAPGAEIAICGALGAGKTTLVRALLKALGSTDAVSSPTYVLSHEYSTPRGIVVEHWDLYRLNGVPLELLEPVADRLRLIEWADKFPELMKLLPCSIEMAAESGAETSTVRSVRINGFTSPLEI